MNTKRVVICVIASLIVLRGIGDAEAHGLIGKCFLPATLAIDDPFVADELSLPTISHIKRPASGDTPATKETDISAEFSKRLTPDLGISLDGSYKILDQERAETLKGFDNLGVTLKYVFFRNAAHQALAAAGLGWDAGGTGDKKVGAESFDTVTPQLFWGKCLGDLPDKVAFLQPLVFTGVFGVAIPTRHANTKTTVTPDGDVEVEREVNGSVAKWGFTVQYDLYYLQNFVRDVGLPAPFNRMVPLVEFAMQTSLDHPKTKGQTTGTINPGIIWFGRYVQIGLEAQIPVNERTGKNVGVLGQLHFYLDDIAPRIFTWTPFHGVLGPTFPR